MDYTKVYLRDRGILVEGGCSTIGSMESMLKVERLPTRHRPPLWTSVLTSAGSETLQEYLTDV